MMDNTVVKGYKVFNPDWTCRGKRYTCPGKFEENVVPYVCSQGLHFCKKAIDCFNYYEFDIENHVAEVIAYGDIAETDDKCCTNKLEIVREIPWGELSEMLNMGKKCTGIYNSGCFNRGSHNSGDYNRGNSNSGYFNNGYYNSGDYNYGDFNTGSCNIGCRNSGDWNKCNHSNGCFNTVEPKIYLFNEPSQWTYSDFENSYAIDLLKGMPMDAPEYVHLDIMTDEEKKEHPEAESIGGYLRISDCSRRRILWWHNISDKNKNIIMSIPNFDKGIFKEITGIDVDAD